jgi:predicted outer membrane repeat protein
VRVLLSVAPRGEHEAIGKRAPSAGAHVRRAPRIFTRRLPASVLDSPTVSTSRQRRAHSSPIRRPVKIIVERIARRSTCLRLSAASPSSSPPASSSALIWLAVSGIFNSEGSLTLTNSTVSGNTAACPTPSLHVICIVEGGGIYNFEGSLTITNSTVGGNTASNGDKSGDGGGILDYSGSVTLTNSAVTGNMANVFGGGIDGLLGGRITLSNSTVAGNTAANGGGIFGITSPGVEIVTPNELITLNNSTISGNTAIGNPRFTPPVPANGGGITDYESLVTLTGSSSVSRNKASGDGGGIYGQDEGCSVTLNNSSSMSRNKASGDGGGIYNGRKCFTLLNGSSSVSRNTASGEGGGIYNEEGEGATISFGIGWNGTVSRNIPDDIFND